MKKAFVYGCAVVAVAGLSQAASAAWTHFRWNGAAVGNGNQPSGFDSARLDLYLDMATFNVPGKKIVASYAEFRYFKGASTTTFASAVGQAQYELSDFNGGFSYDISPTMPVSSNWSFAISLIRPVNQPWTSASPQAFLAATTTPGASLSVLVIGPTFWPGIYATTPAVVTSDVPPPLVPSSASIPALVGGLFMTTRRRR